MITTWFWRFVILYAALMGAVVFVSIVWPVLWTGEIQQLTKPVHFSVRDFLTLSIWLACVVATAVRLLIVEIRAEVLA